MSKIIQSGDHHGLHTLPTHSHECRDESEDEDAQPQREIITQRAFSIWKDERVGVQPDRRSMMDWHVVKRGMMVVRCGTGVE